MNDKNLSPKQQRATGSIKLFINVRIMFCIDCVQKSSFEHKNSTK